LLLLRVIQPKSPVDSFLPQISNHRTHHSTKRSQSATITLDERASRTSRSASCLRRLSESDATPNHIDQKLDALM
jgi:hypothetical protein